MKSGEIIEGERLDIFVARQLPELSRSSAAKLVEVGKVTVNEVIQSKTGFKLSVHDKVSIDYDSLNQPTLIQPDLKVLYEDGDCVVIDKPVGLLTHSKGVFNPEPTVATWLSTKADEQMTGDRAGIVHRLDRATSGVMICAKTPDALSWLQKQFAQRRVKKTYIAVVSGVFKQDEAVIDMPIERNPKKPQTFRVGSNGKSAQTAYRVLQTNNELSLVELKPTTGRTHQLRVHLKHIGHPILGDTFYEGQPADRLYLHAVSLELTLPNRDRKTFTVSPPTAFKQRLQA